MIIKSLFEYKLTPLDGIVRGIAETWGVVELGIRFTIERVLIGNYLPNAARACALLDPISFINGGEK